MAGTRPHIEGIWEHLRGLRTAGNIWERAVQAQQAEQQHTEPQTIPVLFAFSESSRLKHEISFFRSH